MLKLNLQLFAESTDPEEPKTEEGGLAEWQSKMQTQLDKLTAQMESSQSNPPGNPEGIQTIPAPETPVTAEDDPADPDKQPPPKSSRLANFLDWLI